MTQASDSMPAKETYLAQVRSIRSAHPNNLMARHIKENYAEALDLASQIRLWKIVKSGFENPDSNMGAYAQNSSDYQDFQALLDPMIRDYHGIDPIREISQQHDWRAIHSNYNLEDIDPSQTTAD